MLISNSIKLNIIQRNQKKTKLNTYNLPIDDESEQPPNSIKQSTNKTNAYTYSRIPIHNTTNPQLLLGFSAPPPLHRNPLEISPK